MPTSGSVIGANDWDLLDGSRMRMPRSTWHRLNGINMEPYGAKPDIEIPRLPHHIINRLDPQLDKAIQILLDKI